MVPARQTREVGQYLAEMIDYLVEKQNADIKSFHLVGHSLGAHTVGYAGSYTRSGRIPRITGAILISNRNSAKQPPLPHRSRPSSARV